MTKIQFINETADPSKAEYLEMICTEYGLHIADFNNDIDAVAKSTPPPTLALTEASLELRPPANIKSGPVSVNFGSSSFKYRLSHGGGRKQALAKAVGLKKSQSPRILDATAGLGRDGFILAALGCPVILCERSAVVFSLLADGLQRAAKDPELADTCQRITLCYGSSIKLLPQICGRQNPEVIYLDPMFPHRQKTALVKKEMRHLRELVGDDEDSNLLMQTTLKYASKRVVCKRPASAPPISHAPDFSIKTKKHRFDVYLCQ